MKTRYVVLGVVLALLVSFGVGTRPAQAAGSASASVGCTSVLISGTTNAPILGGVLVILGDDTTGKFIFGGIIPADPSGHFSYRVAVPAAVGAQDGDLFIGIVGDGDSPLLFIQQACHDIGFEGPSLPATFVLKTITCDVAVFDAPGGKPVGSNAIKGGQTWYVNPKPVKAPSGESWTEVFVAGYTNGFVPTKCVH